MAGLGRKAAAEQLAKPGQSAGLSQVAGQPVVSSNGSWMSVFSTTTGLFAIAMPTHFEIRFGLAMTAKPQ
jgi:hypothetical protein